MQSRGLCWLVENSTTIRYIYGKAEIEQERSIEHLKTWLFDIHRNWKCSQLKLGIINDKIFILDASFSRGESTVKDRTSYGEDTPYDTSGSRSCSIESLLVAALVVDSHQRHVLERPSLVKT